MGSEVGVVGQRAGEGLGPLTRVLRAPWLFNSRFGVRQGSQIDQSGTDRSPTLYLQKSPSRFRNSPFAGHHQTMAEGRGTSEHETSHSYSPRASGHRSSFRGAKSEARAPLSSLFTCFSGNFPPSGACLRIYEDRSRRPNRSINRTPNRELKSHGPTPAQTTTTEATSTGHTPRTTGGARHREF